MTDPKETPENNGGEEKDKAKDKKVSGTHNQEGANWQENQRIDEEGNELDPDDIK